MLTRTASGVPRLSVSSHGSSQDGRHLWTGELCRDRLPLGQKLSQPCSAEAGSRADRMGAGSLRCHGPALTAEKGVLETKDGYPQLVRLVLVEYPMRRVSV